MTQVRSEIRWNGGEFESGHVGREGQWVDVRPVREVWVERSQTPDGLVLSLNITPAKGVRLDENQPNFVDQFRGMVTIPVKTWAEVVEGDNICVETVTVMWGNEEIVIAPSHRLVVGMVPGASDRHAAEFAERKRVQAERTAAFPEMLERLFVGEGLTTNQRRLFHRWVRRWLNDRQKSGTQVIEFIREHILEEFSAWQDARRFTGWESELRELLTQIVVQEA